MCVHYSMIIYLMYHYAIKGKEPYMLLLASFIHAKSVVVEDNCNHLEMNRASHAVQGQNRIRSLTQKLADMEGEAKSASSSKGELLRLAQRTTMLQASMHKTLFFRP